MEQRRKVYVDVLAEFDVDGGIWPRRMTWEEGAVYDIDRVLHVDRCAAMKAGGQGMRYTVKIRGRVRYLWLEEDMGITRWFIEAPVIQ